MSSDDIEIAQYLIVRFGPPTFVKLSYFQVPIKRVGPNKRVGWIF